jgi:TetR/AcrR family transcriptional regulator, cholesterol catabolism regulator
LSATNEATGQAVDPDSLSPSQRARRQRIVEATVELASEGGFQGVQMRDVAERSGVALGTLYRYFPSKTHLLIGALRVETDALRSRIRRRPPRGETARERVLDVLDRATTALEKNPRMIEAVLRALMTPEADASADGMAASDTVTSLLVDTIHQSSEVPPEDARAIARVLQQVWYFSLVRWLSGRDTSEELRDNLADAARLLLGDH